MIFFNYQVTEDELKKERAKAREIRKTQKWKRKLERGLCYYCNTKVNPKDLTMDHIVPLIRGGKSTSGNIVPACKECNNRKKHMLPSEWDEYLKKLKDEEIDFL